ncbi:uncharacterized protein Z520_02382 [Fonsecaea multimorphosa CBS 102226]|uniref:N-acetyltransferase domain-containing protein n=1 Tax=Fonsecaea multimorphosa CBS 102226 TaxID=1442371 RepID=A0A0D2KZR2_9EURO|nr:uncharacterized protein Z520_02382 [Fonsecaea multimorphosa CBS 102226]KIY02244.1 hypothetical protein Z520_02382 [Fonsecaea multimorphosa CBS 102226]
MPVRRAASADIPVMATVLAAAFGPDRMFQVLFPFKQQHPADFERALRESLWLSWYDYRKVLMVSYKPNTDEVTRIEAPSDGGERQALILGSSSTANSEPSIQTDGETITGIAEWERAGEGSFHVCGLWGWWDPRRLLKPLLSIFYRLRRLIFRNKAAVRPTLENPRPLTYWTMGPALKPFSIQFMNAPHRQTHWSLDILGVHPDFQGRGFGRELVEHGLEMARSDPIGDVPACVMSADGKEAFYQKCGFGDLIGYVSKVEDDKGRENPLRRHGVGGGAVLWTK